MHSLTSQLEDEVATRERAVALKQEVDELLKRSQTVCQISRNIFILCISFDFKNGLQEELKVLKSDYEANKQRATQAEADANNEIRLRSEVEVKLQREKEIRAISTNTHVTLNSKQCNTNSTRAHATIITPQYNTQPHM